MNPDWLPLARRIMATPATDIEKIKLAWALYDACALLIALGAADGEKPSE